MIVSFLIINKTIFFSSWDSIRIYDNILSSTDKNEDLYIRKETARQIYNKLRHELKNAEIINLIAFFHIEKQRKKQIFINHFGRGPGSQINLKLYFYFFVFFLCFISTFSLRDLTLFSLKLKMNLLELIMHMANMQNNFMAVWDLKKE